MNPLKKNKMKKILMAVMAISIMTAVNAQGLADCPLKGTPHCPMLKAAMADAEAALADCPWKGTPDCPLLKVSSAAAALAALEDCPLRGTPECPLTASLDADADHALQNCPLRGTPDCPIMAQRAATGAAASSEAGDAVPACCARKH